MNLSIAFSLFTLLHFSKALSLEHSPPPLDNEEGLTRWNENSALPSATAELDDSRFGTPEDGMQFYLSSKPWPYKRMAMNPDNGAFMYGGGYHMDQLWEVEEHIFKKGSYFLKNVFTSCRLSRGPKMVNCGPVVEWQELVTFRILPGGFVIIKNSSGIRLASNGANVFWYNGSLHPDGLIIFSPRFSVKAHQRVIWDNDNTGGSNPFPSPVWVDTVGFETTNSQSFETGLSSTVTIENSAEAAYKGIGLSSTMSTSLTVEMRYDVSSSKTETWSHSITRGPYSAPAGTHYKIIAYGVEGSGHFGGFIFTPERTCVIEIRNGNESNGCLLNVMGESEDKEVNPDEDNVNVGKVKEFAGIGESK